MSHWWTNELYISLSPFQVGAVHVRRSPGLTGVKKNVIAKQCIDRKADGYTIDWDWALQEMDALLPRYSDDRPNVTLVLSNHFIHYMLVPWNGLISSDEEHLTFARHQFQMTYGMPSTTLELRISQSDVGAAQLASAASEQLLMACSEIVKRHDMKIESVQPYFMSAFNQYKSQIRHTEAWFALVEPGAICLGRIHQGQWMRFRTARLDNGWHALARFMEREAFLEESEAGADEPQLYVFAPHMGSFQTINGWKVHEIPANLPVEMEENQDNSLVMALSG